MTGVMSLEMVVVSHDRYCERNAVRRAAKMHNVWVCYFGEASAEPESAAPACSVFADGIE